MRKHEKGALAQQKIVEVLSHQESELRATLYGIGDGVISTDIRGYVTRMNQVAEKLTGWTEADATDRPLNTVFNIINETTRCQLENLVTNVLREGRVCGPTNHSLLISKDGREIPIADSGAPIFDSQKNIIGVVLIFRDQTEERLTQRLAETRISLIEYAADHTLDELLTRTLDLVSIFVQSPIGCYHFVDADQRSLSLRKWYPPTQEEFCREDGKGARYDMNRDGEWATCVQDKKPLICNDPVSSPDWEMAPDDYAGAMRQLLVPVIREGKVVAILGVGNKPDEYTQKDVEIVSFLADVTWNIVQLMQAAQERRVNLKFFKSMDMVNRAMQQTNDFEQMMRDVMDTVLSIFDCDRSFLLYPCDPEAPSWFVAMQRTRPEYPGIHSFGQPIPMDPNVARILRTSLDISGPVAFCPGSDHPPPDDTWEKHHFRSQMTLALYPKVGAPWLFGLHQCSEARVWTPEEVNLLDGIGMRLSDCLTGVLMNRDLRQSEGFLESIVEHIPNMIYVKDAQTQKFVKFNKAGEQLLGYSREELLGKDDYDLFPKEEADNFISKDREVLEKKKHVEIPEETIKNRYNEEHVLHTQKIPIQDETGTPRYLLGISQDITKRKKLEEQLRQAQKLEAVGQLAGGVAHDFNNMLNVILGHAELALEQSNMDRKVAVHLKNIRNAAERSAELTQQLLAFARKQTVAPKVLDLNRTVEGMLKMLRRLIGEEIDISWLPGCNIGSVKVDPSQLDQILVNLCINARDAISGGGKVTIETETVEIDEGEAAMHVGVITGEYVQLIVSDNGHGMDKDVLGKVFEPFFTTKPTGRGTGLGLATIYGIVQQNNGFINVYSEPGRGSTFKIYLPRHEADSEQAKTEISSRPAAGGKETILLVEDEPAILEVGSLMLERLGYRVFAVPTPEEAIRKAEEHAGEIHLLITDVVMPEMNGQVLSNRILSAHPNIRLIFMSGYTADVIDDQGVLEEGIAFIQKPFSVQTLATRVRQVLDDEL